MLTKRKQIITKFYQERGRMPHYAEIMKLLDYRSKNSVFRLVKKLEEDKFLKKDKQGKLIPLKLSTEIKLLGEVEAGFPSVAEEELLDSLSLDEFLINNREASYLLRVSGDSMKEAGIMPGDLVIADRSLSPAPGNIVIASVDEAWTMKYLRKQGNRVYLQAANKKYPDIYPQAELKIAAVVTGVIRKYQ